jgi:hypothetical protein
MKEATLPVVSFRLRFDDRHARLSDKTVFVTQENGAVMPVEGTPKLDGQKVKVWSTAPILESYPCQGGADTVLLQ